MATVETVTGPIEADQLGTTLIHEHLIYRDEAVATWWPHVGSVAPVDPPRDVGPDELHEAAMRSARAVLEHGVRTVCEPTGMFGGRDVEFSRRVAEDSGLQLVPCTGIYTYDYLPMYFVTRDADAMADLFVHDVTESIQGTGIKAAFLKCAADAPGVTPNVEKVHRACARASVQTGAPIMAHSRPANETGPRQIEIFDEEGVDLARVQIAHTGDTDDLDYIERVLDKGVWIGLDRYGLPMFLPTDKRNATVAELIRRGHTDRIHISQDYCATIDWFPEEAVQGLIDAGLVEGWSMTLVFDEVLPALREEGVLDDTTERTIFVENPRRWMAGE